MAKEHIHHLHAVFDWFREHNLKQKLTKCEFFRNKITYLAHWVLKEGVCPSNSNLTVITEYVPPQTYTEIQAFLGMVGHYQRFIKGFACIIQPLSEYLSGEGAGKKSDWVSFNEDPMKAFTVLKHVCMMTPILVFSDYTIPFLLETDASKEGLEVVLLQKQADE